MALITNNLDRKTKHPGDIGICNWHLYPGIEVIVVDRFDPIEYEEYLTDDWDPAEQIWIRRTDGNTFNLTIGNPIRRHNNKEELINEAWISITNREWDPEGN